MENSMNYKWGIPFIKTWFFSSPVWVLRLLIASGKCIFFQAHQFSFQARHFPHTLAPRGLYGPSTFPFPPAGESEFAVKQVRLKHLQTAGEMPQSQANDWPTYCSRSPMTQSTDYSRAEDASSLLYFTLIFQCNFCVQYGSMMGALRVNYYSFHEQRGSSHNIAH